MGTPRSTPATTRRDPLRLLRSAPTWAVLAAALGVLIAIIVVGTRSPNLPAKVGPRTGPPDTLSVSGLPLPDPGLRTRYLERALGNRSPREIELADLADRYDVTEPLARMIYEEAEAQGIDPELGFRLIRVESVFDAAAVGPGGALGFCQLMFGTARDIDPKIKTHKDVMDPRTNLRLGFTNLRNMITLFKGDVRLGVIAYNRGEIAVQRALRRGKDPENGYGIRVLGPRAHGGQEYTGKGLLPRADSLSRANPYQ